MSDERTPTAHIAPFGLRMQPDLKARVEKAAKANNRSLNSEIVALILDGFEWRDQQEWWNAQHMTREEEAAFEAEMGQRDAELQAQSDRERESLAEMKRLGEQISRVEDQLKESTNALIDYFDAVADAAHGDDRRLKNFMRLAREGKKRGDY